MSNNHWTIGVTVTRPMCSLPCLAYPAGSVIDKPGIYAIRARERLADVSVFDRDLAGRPLESYQLRPGSRRRILPLPTWLCRRLRYVACGPATTIIPMPPGLYVSRYPGLHARWRCALSLARWCKS